MFFLWRRSTFLGISVLGCIFAPRDCPRLESLPCPVEILRLSFPNLKRKVCVFFFWGAQPSWGFRGTTFRFAYGPSLVVGCPLGPSAVLQGFLCCLCLSDTVFDRFLSFPGLVLPRNLSLVRLSFPAFPPSYGKGKQSICVCFVISPV